MRIRVGVGLDIGIDAQRVQPGAGGGTQVGGTKNDNGLMLGGGGIGSGNFAYTLTDLTSAYSDPAHTNASPIGILEGAGGSIALSCPRTSLQALLLVCGFQKSGVSRRIAVYLIG